MSNMINISGTVGQVGSAVGDIGSAVGEVGTAVGETVGETVSTSIDRFWILKKIFGDFNFANMINGIIIIFLIIVLSRIVVKISDKAIIKFFNRNKKMKKFGMRSRKADTLSVIIQSLVKYFIYFIALVMILQQIGIETNSLIATAGIGGVALGFGAKSLVQDVITGFFILFEDQYSVGEHVRIEGREGIVEDMQIRVTKVRDFSGELHIIPNGQINIVTNMNRGSIKADVNLRIPYDSDMEKVFSILKGVSEKIKERHKDSITHDPVINGVAEFTTYDMRVNMYVMTKPTKQFGVAYDMRKLAIEDLEKSGIEVKVFKGVTILNDQVGGQNV